MNQSATLLSIIAYARSGAQDYAWRLFREAGFEEVGDDPAVLNVRGRLLKDRALGAEGTERRRSYLEAADAYARSAEIDGANYPLINAATLSLLAGRKQRARTLARKVLERFQGREEYLETPYYRAATRAEALLLLGEIAQAKAVFAEAISRAPGAYEDHASTLRQFGLILDELDEDKSWLEAHRPPRSAHFAGHMALASDADMLGEELRTLVKNERIGFGYGALAAGADILIAETLLEENAELHLTLPAPQDQFRDESVARFGDGWAQRFDAIVKAADTVRSVARDCEIASPLAIRLAAEVAMGSAVMQANMLTTEAIQLLILDGKEHSSRDAGDSGWIASNWVDSGRRQYVLAAPRIRARAPKRKSGAAEALPRCLAAMLRIDLSGMEAIRLSREVLPRLAGMLAKGPAPVVPPRWTGEAAVAAYDTPDQATRIALAAATAFAGEASIAAHYAIVWRAEDPFGGERFLAGDAAALPAAIAHSTPRGAIHVSEDFAAAFHAGAPIEPLRSEFVGELPASDPENPVRLYSLKR